MSVEGTEFVNFYPCSTSSDLDSKPFCYKPLFVHHFFPSGFRFGNYKHLNIQLFYTIESLYTYLAVSGEFKESTPERDIPCHLLELEKALFVNLPFPDGFLTRTQFIKKLDCRSELKFASTPVYESRLEDGRQFKLYSVKPGNKKIPIDFDTESLEKSTRFIVSGRTFTLGEQEEFQSIGNNSPLHVHRRMEWHCHWFIESMSNIKYDESWEIFFPVICPFKSTSSPNTERSPNHSVVFDPKAITGRDTYHLIGLATCYHFFTIDRTRLRISQFFIFPQWQRNGLGIEILEAIYTRAIEDDGIREITVEDPSPSFATIRDIVGLQLCLKRGVITHGHLSPDGNGPGTVTVQEISRVCKENKTQAARLLEILLLASVKAGDCDNDCTLEAYSVVRLRAKKRMKVENEELLASVQNYKELLAEMWEERFHEYVRSINKVRKLCGVALDN
ncbi:histone acetyltransferase 1 [Babesia microti strain RI]|uniref:histone acetyltransferase n=1 Tax=Babesia microti (strain RI) TaxID=1133968 RepID=A0A1R4AAU9_BABMR|nr:histone acetyltransferase 1 [Babesia microti strain RI]SJK86129.1 histone acetyltransferase 1 [Babesia microti strain RI]|eukprot:XP_021338323.1 histone acetyltransferase 1 [Babesia microti strain RI]